jgi:hypothetical protein
LAVNVAGELYRIVEEKIQPEDERWPFEVGSIVKCQSKTTPGGEVILVAQELAKDKPKS